MQRVFQLGPGPVGPGPAGADAAFLQLPDFFLQALRVPGLHVPHQGGRVSRRAVDALRGGHEHQGLRVHQLRDHRRGLVVVHAFMNLRPLLPPDGQLHLPVFLVGHRIVIVHDGNGFLPRGSFHQRPDMLPLLRIVEMGMLHQDLPDAVFRRNKLPVGLHQDGLSLGGVVRLILIGIPAELASRSLHIIQPADFRGPAGHPDHAGPEFLPQPGENIVIHLLILFPDQGHGPDLSHQIKLIAHFFLASSL